MRMMKILVTKFTNRLKKDKGHFNINYEHT